MKLYILHENDSWMIPIRKALQENKVNFVEWNVNKSNIIKLQESPPKGVFYNRVSPSSHTRGDKNVIHFTQAILEWLKRYNRKVINAKKAFEIEINKAAQYTALLNDGIKVPDTQVVFGKESIVNTIDNIQYPIIIKPNRGGKGIGVHIFHNKIELNDFLFNEDYVNSPDGLLLLQQYIKPKENSIMRAEFINKKFVYAVKVDTSGGFNLCPADSCTIKEYTNLEDKKIQNKFTIMKEFSNEIILKYQKFLEKNEIDTAGIEFIIDENGILYTYDVNVTTNYNTSAEEKSGISCYHKLAVFLKEQVDTNLSSSIPKISRI